MNALGVTTITMDEEILEEIDEIRLHVGVSRSALIREVLRRMALEHEEACRRREYQEKERRETIEGESS